MGGAVLVIEKGSPCASPFHGTELELALLSVLATIFAHLLLSRTLLGRWLYAVGHNPWTSFISGVPVGGVTISAYLLSGVFAATAAILLTARLETGSPNHGKALLLDIIGAAVIGGTSLFGGCGRVFPGTVLGAVLLKCIFNGLVIVQADPYFYPLITSAIIFVAVLLDSLRSDLIHRFSKRRIRLEEK